MRGEDEKRPCFGGFFVEKSIFACGGAWMAKKSGEMQKM